MYVVAGRTLLKHQVAGRPIGTHLNTSRAQHSDGLRHVDSNHMQLNSRLPRNTKISVQTESAEVSSIYVDSAMARKLIQNLTLALSRSVHSMSNPSADN